MKFLCLHGVGSNPRIFETQTAPLRHALSAAHQFRFVEGLISHPQDPEINVALLPEEKYYTYFKEDLDTVLDALKDLDDFIRSDGPFDAILGFSQGASLAATYLAHQYPGAGLTAYEEIRIAVFISGSPPWVITQEGTRTADASLDGELIPIPSVHVYGTRDPIYKENMKLSELFPKHSRSDLKHDGGHELPRTGQHMKRLADLIEGIIVWEGLLFQPWRQ